MKKIYIFTVLVAAALMTASCTKNEIESSNFEEGFTFNAEMESWGGEGGTKYVLDDQLRYYPTSNNWLYLYSDSKSAKRMTINTVSADTETGTIVLKYQAKGSFESDDAAKESFASATEMYLTSGDSSVSLGESPFTPCTDADKIPCHQQKVKICSEQKADFADGKCYPKTYIPLVAHWKGEAGHPYFQFKIACSMVKIHVDVSGLAEGVKLSSIRLDNGCTNEAENKKITGRSVWYVNLETGAVDVKNYDGDQPYIILSKKSENNVYGTGDYYFCVKANRRIRFPKITFNYSDGTSDVYTNSKIDKPNDTDIVRGTIYNFGSFTLPKAK